jgi:circadian clock protein KaiC
MLMVERIKTHVAGLDELIEGGFPKGAIILVSGTPGTGKSILCAQVAYHNALNGKKCLYLNLEQNEGRLEAQMEQFGWDIKKTRNNLITVPVDSADPRMVEYLLREIQAAKYDLIILDSLDSISTTPTETTEQPKMNMEKVYSTVIPTIMDTATIGRMRLKKIFSAIAKSKATAILTSERVEGGQGISRDTISEFLCDGIIIVKSLAIGKNFNRTLQISKMRLTEIDGGIKSLSITKKGLLVE